MAYNVQNSTVEQVAMFRNILASLGECDLIIVTNDGRTVFSHKKLLCIFSNTLPCWLNSLSSCEKDLGALSVDASFQAVSNMITVLSSGKAVIAREEELLDMVEVAELLGIDMENSEIEFKKSVEAVRSGTSKKKRIRNKPKTSWEEFIFIKEEDHLTIDTNIAECIGNETTVMEETVEEETYPEENNTETENGESMVENIKSEPGNEVSEEYYQEANDNHEDLLVDDGIKLVDLQVIIPPSLKRRRAKIGKNLECNQCGEMFAYKLNLKKHQQIHSEEKPFKCADCGEKFAKKSSLKLHKANKNKKYKCEVCGAAFGKGSDFKRHKLTHLVEKPFKCDICPKQFTQQRNLENHMNIYQSISEEKHREISLKKLEAKCFPCDECGLMLTSNKNVKTHKQILHSNIRPFQCIQCRKSFPHVGALNHHNKKYHQAFRRNKTLYVLNTGSKN